MVGLAQAFLAPRFFSSSIRCFTSCWGGGGLHVVTLSVMMYMMYTVGATIRFSACIIYLMQNTQTRQRTCLSDVEKLLRAGRLHDRAEAVLRQRLATVPQDAQALLRLGDLHRRRGNFPAAAEAYERLCVLRPAERRASWLRAVTAGEQLPATPQDGLRAAPFVYIRDFLSSAERERMLSSALAMRERFEPGGVGRANRKVISIKRRALEARLPSSTDVGAWFVRKLREALPKVSMLLRIDELHRCRLSLTMVAHADGGFGARHRDPFPCVGVCYFHRPPRPFSGGDLLLYDTEVETGTCSNSDFSRVEPVAGSIVFYPGLYQHEVTAVAGPPDFAAARFSVGVTFVPEAA